MRKRVGKISNEKDAKRYRRRLHARKILSGTAEVPRVCTFKSNKNLYVQIIDDVAGNTVLSAQTFGKNAIGGGKNGVESAKQLGAQLAEKLKGKSITRVVFDKNGYKYTGVLAALATSMRENGIQI